MSDLDQILIDTTTKLIKESCTKELINEAEQGDFPKELWESLEEFGLTKVGVPEDAGGSGFSPKEALNILHIAGKYSAPLPLAETMAANWLLHEAGLGVQSGTFTPVLDVPFLGNEQDSWTISGTVSRVPFVRYVDRLVVIGQSESGQPLMTLVDRGSAKVVTGENLAGEARDDVTFNNVRVPSEAVKKISSETVAKAHQLFTLTRIVLMAGALERTLELTIQYAQERKQFGRPIGKFQAVKQQIAVMAGQVSSASIAADYAIDAFDRGGDVEKELMIAKVHLGEVVGVAVPIAHQVHAAIGFTYEHPLHHSTRRLWAWRDEGGAESVWAKRLGKKILDEKEKPVWEMVT